MHGQQHIVGGLGHLTGSRRARMKDLLSTAHALEDQSRSLEAVPPCHRT